MAQRFYALVLMPVVRDDIAVNKRLNYHYYMALKKARAFQGEKKRALDRRKACATTTNNDTLLIILIILIYQ